MTQKEYRITNGMELTQSKHHSSKSMFVISDLHLDHTNIITYCKRPFDSVEEMNDVLIKNWNYVVKPGDTVFFVGDFTFGSPEEYFPQLNGHIRFISGNHDETLDPDGLFKTLHYSYKGIDFFFIHETRHIEKEIPDGFDGWVIHGHHHNNHPRLFPFFDPEKKRINVSAELVKYQPISLDFIHSLITGGHKKIMKL